MLFDENYNKLIQLLGKYDNEFLTEYQKFISKFPDKLLNKASKGKEFFTDTPNGRCSYAIHSTVTKHEHNLTLLGQNNDFTSLNVYPKNIHDPDLHGVNKVLSLSLRQLIGFNATYSFEIFKVSGKNILLSVLDKNTKNKYEEKMHELTDAEFEFILDTISHPFEKDNNKEL